MTMQSSIQIDLDEMRADPRFSQLDGRGQTVVVLDSGIDINHPFFGFDFDKNGVADRIRYQYDFVDNDNNASDGNDHGSNVASIIGSQDATQTGMSPGVNLIILRTLDNFGAGSYADQRAALQWVINNGAAYNVVAVNMSLSTPGSNYTASTASQYSSQAAGLAALNIAVIGTAGNYFASAAVNGNPGVNDTGADPNIWAVSAVTDTDKLAGFSQRSPILTDILAPGTDITGANRAGGTVTQSGTSQAAPHISGIVALAQQLASEITGGAHMDKELILDLMQQSGVPIFDSDTGATYRRVDVDNLMGAIYDYYNHATSGADLLRGANGIDSLNGGRGNDVIYGRIGDDDLRGGAGEDTLYGEYGADYLDGGEDNDKVYGGPGNDWIQSDPGDDYLDGGENIDTLFYQNANSTVFVDLHGNVAEGGGLGNDRIYNIENVVGSRFDDSIQGDDGRNHLQGGNGNDQLWGNGGDDILDGGDDNDTAYYTYAPNGVVVVLDSNYAGGDGTDTLISIENIVGSIYDDRIYGSADANLLFGGFGKDEIHGGLGDDELSGGGGADELYGDQGDDRLFGGSENDKLYGGDGNDILIGGAGADLMDGGAGVDTISYAGSNAAVTVKLAFNFGQGGHAEKDVMYDIENVIGSVYGDQLTGDFRANALQGGGGNDVLDGGENDDTAEYSGARTNYLVTRLANGDIQVVDQRSGSPDGTDTLRNIENLRFADGTFPTDDFFAPVFTASADVRSLPSIGGTFDALGGNDVMNYRGGFITVDGGAGNDTLDFSAFASAMRVDLQASGSEGRTMDRMTLAGGSWRDIADIANVENLVGTVGADELRGDGQANRLGGLAGDDTLSGRGGNDVLTGGAGNDTLDGGKGIDTALFAGPRSAYKIDSTADGGRVTGPDGVDTLHSIERLTFDDVTISRPDADFNGDFRADILWHGSTGDVATWEMNGRQVQSAQSVGAAGGEWQVGGTGDFDGDGLTEIVWFNQAKEIATWEMNGNRVESTTSLDTIDPSWHLGGIGDFDANGCSDLLWRKDNGEVAIWNNGQNDSARTVGSVGGNWHIVGTGDFDGNGRSDVLWQSDTGEVSIWRMNGTQVEAAQLIGEAGGGWHINGIADFDGNGCSDILWRSDAGEVSTWELNGGRVEGARSLGMVGGGWEIVGARDFEANGLTDILWHNESGEVSMWEVNGGEILSAQSVGFVGGDWKIVSAFGLDLM